MPDGNPATGGAVVTGPAVAVAFGPAGGDETGLSALAGGVPVDGQAQGESGRGGTPDNGSNATAAVANTTTHDDRASGAGAVTGRGAGGVYLTPGGAAIAADFASTDPDDAFGGPGRL
jgi:hypothetical protein